MKKDREEINLTGSKDQKKEQEEKATWFPHLYVHQVNLLSLGQCVYAIIVMGEESVVI